MTENQKEQKAGHAGAIIGFKTRKGEIVHARVASSFIGFEQADRNLKELGNDSFDTLVQKGQDAWNEVLGKIEVDGGNLDQYRTFYSCLYFSPVLFMNLMKLAILFIIVLTMVRYYLDICIRIPASGILSVACSLSST